MRFKWDGSKAASTLKKHHVSFGEAVTLFSDPLAATFDDPDHSQGAIRLVTVGSSARGRLLVVCHAVNEALRSLLRMSEATRRLTSRSSGRATAARG